jgi:hypothetical protein
MVHFELIYMIGGFLALRSPPTSHQRSLSRSHHLQERHPSDGSRNHPEGDCFERFWPRYVKSVASRTHLSRTRTSLSLEDLPQVIK